MIDENMISKLVDKLENNQLNLAKIENKVASFEHNLLSINNTLVGISDEIKKTNIQIEYLKNDRKEQIIQSMGNKPKIRWWHRLGDKISKYHKCDTSLVFLGMFFIISFILYIVVKTNNFWIQFAILTIFIFVIGNYKYSNKFPRILKIISLITRALKFVRFTIIIAINSVVLYVFTEPIYKALSGINENFLIIKVNNYLMKLFSLNPAVTADRLIYSFTVFIILYAFVIHYMYVGITKATLQYFNDKWMHYKPNPVTSIWIYILIIFFIHIIEEMDSYSVKQINTLLVNNFSIPYIIIYIISLIDLMIANYQIDKKRLAKWEEKNKQLQQFTNSLDNH